MQDIVCTSRHQADINRTERYYRAAYLKNSIRNIRKVDFLNSHFLCPYCEDNIKSRELAQVCGTTTIYKDYFPNMPESDWFFNDAKLDAYIDGKAEYHLVVGHQTKFSAFTVDGSNEKARKKAVRILRKMLISEFGVPSQSIVVYRNSGTSNIVSVLFYLPIRTNALAHIQRCVVQRAILRINNNNINVKDITRIGNIVALPFGAVNCGTVHRDLLDAERFQPVKNLIMYSKSHRGFSVNINHLNCNMYKLTSTIDTLEPIKEPMPFVKPERIVNMYSSEMACIANQKTKSLRLILFIMLLCSKLFGDESSGVFCVSISALIKLSGISAATVNRALAEFGKSGIIKKMDVKTVDAEAIKQAAKGPHGNMYTIGPAFYISIDASLCCYESPLRLEYVYEAFDTDNSEYLRELYHYASEILLDNRVTDNAS